MIIVDCLRDNDRSTLSIYNNQHPHHQNHPTEFLCISSSKSASNHQPINQNHLKPAIKNYKPIQPTPQNYPTDPCLSNYFSSCNPTNNPSSKCLISSPNKSFQSAPLKTKSYLQNTLTRIQRSLTQQSFAFPTLYSTQLNQWQSPRLQRPTLLKIISSSSSSPLSPLQPSRANPYQLD